MPTSLGHSPAQPWARMANSTTITRSPRTPTRSHVLASSLPTTHSDGRAHHDARPFLPLAAGDPGRRGPFRGGGLGLTRLASIPGSVIAPQSRHRHPVMEGCPISLIWIATKRPWQRRQRIAFSCNSNLQHLLQCSGPYNALINRFSMTSMAKPNPPSPDKY